MALSASEADIFVDQIQEVPVDRVFMQEVAVPVRSSTQCDLLATRTQSREDSCLQVDKIVKEEVPYYVDRSGTASKT